MLRVITQRATELIVYFLFIFKMYTRLIIILGFLCILECSAFSGLLQWKYGWRSQSQPFIHGESELIRDMIDAIDTRGVLLESHILGGNFIPLMSDDEDDGGSMNAPKAGVSKDDPEKRSLQGISDAFKNALSKLPDPLQKIVTFFRENFHHEMTTMMNATKKEESKEQLSNQIGCNNLKADCLGVENFGVRCMLDCLTKGNRMVNKYSGHIAMTLRTLCEPIGTDFASVYENMGNSQGSPLEGYLRAIKSGPTTEQIAQVTKIGAKSLLYLMSTGVATSLLPMGVVCQEMKDLLNKRQTRSMEMKNDTMAAASAANGTTPSAKVKLGNPLCTPSMLVDETFQMAQIFEREPSLLDILLPGYTTLATMVKYVPGDHQPFYSGFVDAFEIMTGMTCGLVSHAEGSKTDCNHMGGFPRSGVRMPEKVKRVVPGWKAFCKGYNDAKELVGARKFDDKTQNGVAAPSMPQTGGVSFTPAPSAPKQLSSPTIDKIPNGMGPQTGGVSFTPAPSAPKQLSGSTIDKVPNGVGPQTGGVSFTPAPSAPKQLSGPTIDKIPNGVGPQTGGVNFTPAPSGPDLLSGSTIDKIPNGVAPQTGGVSFTPAPSAPKQHSVPTTVEIKTNKDGRNARGKRQYLRG